MITPSTNRQDYIKLIDSFEDVDTPSQFGLPLNVERSVQRAKSSAVISQLKKLARSMALLGSGGSGNKFNREQWRTELGPLIELWDRLIKSSRDVLEPNDWRGIILYFKELSRSKTFPFENTTIKI